MVKLSKYIFLEEKEMKRVICCLLVTLFAFQLFPSITLATNESGSPKHIPRVVSVVFDDSGSMYKDTDRWAYTSYAMQAFTAMMSDEDVLYVTYLNAPAGTVKIDLSSSAKQGNIDNIEKTMFGGGTPNKLARGAECLKTEYQKYGNNAKYYLVVLADGLLDAGQGDMSAELGKIAQSTSSALSGADFETIYFSMLEKANVSISGVTSHSATSGSEIVNVLRNISADIMGRTKVDFSVSGGKVSFDLDYPALSIAVFVQKQNASFSGVQVPIKRNGKNVSYDTGVFYVDCPTEIVKNMYTSVYNEKIPVNPPSGFVTLVENGNGSIDKGSYTLDLSKYNVSKNDLVVLVEPAVKLGCKYYIGDSTKALSFEEFKGLVRDGDEVTVECGLYEMNSDGSLGEPIPTNVLSPEYNLYVNDEEIGKKNGKSKFEFVMSEEHAHKQLKIEAVLKGYQPFVLRETFGEINLPIGIDPDSGSNDIKITLTKPELQDWISGKKEIRFSLIAANSAVLNSLSIKAEGIKGLDTGKCSSLSSVSVSGNDVVYTPALPEDTVYSKLPESFKITLVDDSLGKGIATATVTVIQPEYKIETVNGLKDIPLNLGALKSNDRSVGFELKVCYDGSGVFKPISDFDCEKDISFKIESGTLTGSTKEKDGGIYFTPKYDPAENTQVSPADIVGKDHVISVTATVDGVTVKSEDVTLSVVGGSYKIEIENQITNKLNLDSIKTNENKVVFRIYADYSGNGAYGDVADWDTAVFDKLEITAGKLPGIVSVEKDGDGNIIGKSFMPLYDENNNNDVVFTEVAGRVHTVTAKITGTEILAETTVEVLAPDYEIIVQKEGFIVMDTDLCENKTGLEFIIMRDGRELNKRELEGFAPYSIELSKSSKKLVMHVTVAEGEDGKAYLCCVPVYEGWLPFFFAPHGSVEAKLNLGGEYAAGSFAVSRDPVWIGGCIIAIIILIIILYLIVCNITVIRIDPGTFYVAELDKNGSSWKVKKCKSSNAFRLFVPSIIPRTKQTEYLYLGNKSVEVRPKENSVNPSLFEANYPAFDRKAISKNGVYMTKSLSKSTAKRLIKKDNTIQYSFDKMSDTFTKNDNKRLEARLSITNALYYEDGNKLYIAFYIPKKDNPSF